MNGMLIGDEPLDLALTLMDSAQCFVWVKTEAGYGTVLDGQGVLLRSGERGIEAEGDVDVQTLRRYLDLDRDYGAVALEYDTIPQARLAMKQLPGLRVLNQPAWDALVSFILSANNNVRRIRNLVHGLCERFGAERTLLGIPLYGMPPAQVLADVPESKLREMGMGYRAPFLIQSARAVAEGFPLSGLCRMPYEEAHRMLKTLPGVGDKVADCVLLFGCGRTEAFPVDVWVERLLREWFGLSCTSRRELASRARTLLGAHAGLLQQFLFHAARTGAIAL
ncbi:MAG: hypothetical protein IJH38_02515 [Clostridia bacterium]|nr:hypothetical protein [Clostridia bacterium]